MNQPAALELVLRRDHLIVTVALGVVIAGSWVYLLTGAGMGMYPHEIAALIPVSVKMAAPMSSAMGAMMAPAEWTPTYGLIMLVMWWLMMLAMMLPSAAPMVLLHAAVTRKSSSKGAANTSPFAATSAFTAGYLLLWGGFSVVAVWAQWGLEATGRLSTMMTSTHGPLGAGLLLAAGIWQLTPLKYACLARCRSPISFLSEHWHPGIGGALRMGMRHGLFCLGCCWFLMALLFYGGVMNLIWILGLALYVLIEKLLPAGVLFGKITGALLVLWGAWLAISTLLSA